MERHYRGAPREAWEHRASPDPRQGETMRAIAIVNQKGGCGKTTTTVNLAGCLADEGAAVLVVDLDPQAHATLALGVDPEGVDENLYEVLADPEEGPSLSEIILPIHECLHVAPSGVILAALEQKLADEHPEARTRRIAESFATVQRRYDYVLVDCPPNVGLLTLNALRAADEVIVPLETSHFAIHGAHKVLETIAVLADRIGQDPSVRILPTLYDGRTRFARDTLAEIREMFGDLCFDTVIRTNVTLREAARHGRPLVQFRRSANGARDYTALAAEVAAAADDQRDAREVVIEFRDDHAVDVRIAGDFNGWIPDRGVESVDTSEGSARVWRKILYLRPGEYEYRYVVDGEWRPDPDNPETVPGGHGPPASRLVVR